MMKEWEIRRLMYLKTNPDPGDVIMFDELEPRLQGKRIFVHDNSVTNHPGNEIVVTLYFKTSSNEVIVYPQKSYAVALVYAKLLEKYFGEPFYDALNHPSLLLGDKFFVPYSKNPDLYNRVIAKMDEQKLWDFENNTLDTVQATVNYFKKEFLLV